MSIEKLKEFVFIDGKYSNIHSNKILIKKYFPEIYEQLKDNYHVKLYMLLNDIKETPTCKNPSCQNKVSLKSISKGFRSYCSKKCLGEHQHIDKEFKQKISKSQLKKNILSSKYPELTPVLDTNKNYIILKDYCKHGDIKLHRKTFDVLYKNKINLCQSCKDEFINTYKPTNEDIFEFQDNFEEFHNKYRFKFREDWFKREKYKEYAIILYWSKHIKDAILSERIYMFKHKIKERPKCISCGKNDVHFNQYSAILMHVKKIHHQQKLNYIILQKL